MENFLLPSKIEFQPGADEFSGSLIITPCYHGYGTTLGNALRRVLLSSLPGGAVESFKVKGVSHEFSAVEGVKEDAVEIILNLKQLAVRVFSDEPVKLNLIKKGKGPVTAADIEKNADVEVINKDLVICNLTGTKALDMEITVGRGRGYKPVEEKNKDNNELGTILIDSVYSPIKDVGYKVEYTRLGDITNYEKLTVNIETDGTITPQAAVAQATQILMDHFSTVLGSLKDGMSAPQELVEDAPEKVEEEVQEMIESVGAEEEGEEKSAKKAKKKSAKKK